MCSQDPAVSLRWRVRNTYNETKVVTWDVYGNSQHGTLSVPANSDAFFDTQLVLNSPNTVRLFLDGAQKDVKASGFAKCAVEPSPSASPTTEPTIEPTPIETPTVVPTETPITPSPSPTASPSPTRPLLVLTPLCSDVDDEAALRWKISNPGQTDISFDAIDGDGDSDDYSVVAGQEVEFYTSHSTSSTQLYILLTE
jgi:hypothetical protein